jgi:hypothetical protein
METFMDVLTALVGRAAAPWVGVILLSSPLWLLAAVRFRRSLERRRAFKEFAAAHQLTFAGTIPSDARPPYTRIERVAWAVLLSNTMEGQWDGLPVRLFDMPPARNKAPWTAILVTVEGTLRRGEGAERVIVAGPEAFIETNLDVLYVTPRGLLEVSELTTWLSFATALAKAMERDDRESRAFETDSDRFPGRTPNVRPNRTLIPD